MEFFENYSQKDTEKVGRGGWVFSQHAPVHSYLSAPFLSLMLPHVYKPNFRQFYLRCSRVSWWSLGAVLRVIRALSLQVVGIPADKASASGALLIESDARCVELLSIVGDRRTRGLLRLVEAGTASGPRRKGLFGLALLPFQLQLLFGSSGSFLD